MQRFLIGYYSSCPISKSCPELGISAPTSHILLYDYLLKGNFPHNIQLRDQDIVVIPVRRSTVEVDSAIVNPGIYEGVAGESVFDLIQYAGGLLSSAYPQLTTLQRIDIKNERILLNLNLNLNQKFCYF